MALSPITLALTLDLALTLTLNLTLDLDLNLNLEKGMLDVMLEGGEQMVKDFERFW